MNDVWAVVRSVGEKTENLCVGFLRNVFGFENVQVIRDVTPFAETVRMTMESGICHNKKWTLAVDADVLVFEDELKEFIKFADFYLKRNPKAFCIEGLLFDKFFDDYRPVGLHLFNTSLLKDSVRFCQQGKAQLRPETFVKEQMCERGFDYVLVSMKIGIHDFEQSKISIVRKAILHARKHDNIANLMQLWREKNSDEDFSYMLRGAELSLKIQDNPVIVDAGFMDQIIDKYCHDWNWPREKEIDENLLISIMEAKKTHEDEVNVQRIHLGKNQSRLRGWRKKMRKWRLKLGKLLPGLFPNDRYHEGNLLFVNKNGCWKVKTNFRK